MKSYLKSLFSFMHVSPGWIHSTFEYLARKSQNWSTRDRLAAICCDELYIDPSTDIDLTLDMALNPKNGKQAHIFSVRSICGKWKFPFFCDVDKSFTKADIDESILKFYKLCSVPLPDREDGAHAPVCDVGSGRGGGVLHAEEVVVDVRLLRGHVVAP